MANLTTGAAARRLGAPEWAVARVYARGLLPEPPRLGHFRIIREDQLPALRAALVEAAYLKETAEAVIQEGPTRGR